MAIPTKKEPTEKLEGVAAVRNTEDGYLVTLDGVRYEIDAKDAPDFAIPDGEYLVTMNQAGTKLWRVRPETASVYVKFTGFSAKAGELPQPSLQRGGPRTKRDGSKFLAKDKLVFYPIFTILRPKKYKGLEVSYILDYLFVPWEENPTEAAIRLRGNPSDRLVEFLRLTGLDFDKDVIPFSENVLPALEEMLIARGVTLMANIKNGNIDSLALPPEEDED